MGDFSAPMCARFREPLHAGSSILLGAPMVKGGKAIGPVLLALIGSHGRSVVSNFLPRFIQLFYHKTRKMGSLQSVKCVNMGAS